MSFFTKIFNLTSTLFNTVVDGIEAAGHIVADLFRSVVHGALRVVRVPQIVSFLIVDVALMAVGAVVLAVAITAGVAGVMAGSLAGCLLVAGATLVAMLVGLLGGGRDGALFVGGIILTAIGVGCSVAPLIALGVASSVGGIVMGTSKRPHYAFARRTAERNDDEATPGKLYFPVQEMPAWACADELRVGCDFP